MRRMRAVVLVLTALLSPLALALGLGPLETRSSLNEPFEARIAFNGTTAKDFDTLKARLADSAQFAKAGIPRDVVLTALRFEVVAEEPGAEYLRIRTVDPVREPFLNFLIELDWANGRIVREYTVLLDPPAYAQAGPAPISAPVTSAGPALVAAPPAPVASAPAPVAEAPAPVPASAPPPATVAQGEIQVPPGATAWELALDHRPDRSISIHQMMIALVRANPEAFVGGNVNRLRRGVVLRVPDQTEIEALDPPTATAEFQRQFEAWQALRQQMAAPAEATAAAPAPEQAVAEAPAVAEEPAAAADQAEPAAPAEETAAADVADLEAIIDEATEDAATDAAGDDAAAATEEALTADAGEPAAPDALEQALEREARLELSAPETEATSEAPGNDAEGTADPALALESAEVSARENAELEARLTEAEQIIDLLQRQLKVKDEELAALQAKAERAQAAAPPAPEAEGLLDGLVPAPLRDALPGGAATAVGILVALILLLALLIHRAASGRRGAAPAPEEVLAEATEDESVQGAVQELPPIAWKPEPLPELAVEEISEAEAEALTRTGGLEAAPAAVPPPPADELDDVNVFLAYERFDQAEARVRDAITAHPQHLPYKLRLLEVLYAANRLQAYEQAARDLHAAVGGEGELWQGALAMWREMSPARELFAPVTTPERADTEQRPSTTFLDISADAAETVQTTATEPSEEEIARLGDTQVFLPTSVEPPSPPLDLDLGAAQGAGTPASAVVDISSAEAPDSADTTFIDLSFDEPEAGARPRAGAGDAEFDLSDTVSPLSGERPPVATTLETPDLTLDFDLALGATGAGASSGTTAVDDPLDETRFEVTRFDDGAIPEIDLSLDETRAESAPGSLEDFAHELDLSLEDTAEFPPSGGYAEATVPAPETTVGESLADITRSMEASIASLDVDAEGDSVLSLSLEPEADVSDLDLEFTLDDAGKARMVDTMALDPDALRKSAEARNRAELALQGDDEESSPLHQTDTKLNLARAYIELGDAEGARQILQEVLETGNATQLEEARRLMAQLN